MADDPIPIRQVRSDGSVESIGEYDHRAKRITLTRAGYPLLPIGNHPVEGDLPWVLDEMAPAGFLSRRFAHWFPELNLPEDRRLWRAEHVLAAVCRRGHDLPGNLVIGAESWERYQRIFGPGRKPGPSRSECHGTYTRFVEGVLLDAEGSSLGGERPKFTLRLSDGTGLLVKFTPPLSTPLGQRWGDLLRLEAKAAGVLRNAGFPAVSSHPRQIGNRTYLEVERFDRAPNCGRVGAVTFFYLGAALYGEVQSATSVAKRLVAEGRLPAEDVATVRIAEDFSEAIGNTDAHLGNYGLLVDDLGNARLAPLYDISPMAFAPRADELPDAFVRPRSTVESGAVVALLDDLADAMRSDAEVSPEFKKLWLRYIGRD